MSTLKIYNSINAHERKIDGEENRLPSETIPDQTMSISEILKRYANGLPIEGGRVPLYEDEEDDDLPDLSKMDLVDQAEAIERYRDEKDNIFKKHAEQQEQEREAKRKEKYYDEFKREQPKQEPPSVDSKLPD